MPEEVIEGAGSQGGQGGEGEGQAGSAFDADFGAFKESLGELGQDKAFEPIQDFHGLAKSYVEAQKMIGGSIRLPGENLEDVERQKAIGELKGKLMEAGIIEGVPEGPEGYQYERPTLGDRLHWDEGLEKDFISVAHKVGLTNSQVQELINWQSERETIKAGRARDFHKASVETLKKEWGADYERKAVLSTRAAAELGGDEFIEMLEKTRLGDHPMFVKVFAQVGEVLAEDGFISGHVMGAPDKGEVMTKINALMNDKEHPLWDVSKPGHQEAVEEWSKILQQKIAIENRG